MSLVARSKHALRGALASMGYRVQRLAVEERWFEQGFDPTVPLPDNAEQVLRPDHPRLIELGRRYAAVDSPIARHTQWRSRLRPDAVALRYFRGENAYIWNYLKLDNRVQPHELARLRYFVYGRYVREIDRRGLLQRLAEDGRFGCFTFRFHGLPPVSRDLLDSINEMHFLDRTWGLFERTSRVLDIGAGYGRLAHRMLAAVPGVQRYTCVDAIAPSTFLCEFYLDHRGLLGSAGRGSVVPLDRLDQLQTRTIDLALSVHAFSEMSYAAVDAWLQLLVRLEVPWLFLVPNEPELLSREADGSRRPCSGLLEQSGYRLVVRELAIADPDVRELFGAHDHFLLYQRA